MMKRTILAVVVAVAAVSTGIGAALVSARHHAAPAASHSNRAVKQAPSTETMRFTSKDSKSKYVDAKPSGLSAGDVLTQHSVWYQHGANVGSMALTATVALRRTAETGEV